MLLTSQFMEDFETAVFKNVAVRWWWRLLFVAGKVKIIPPCKQ